MRTPLLARSFGVGLAVVVAMAVQVTPAGSETLYDALAAAYANNPSLKAERAALRATDEGVPEALSDWRPSVELDASAGHQATFNSQIGADRRQSRQPRSLTFSVNQPLFRGGRTQAATRSAENSVLAGRARLSGVEQNVLLQAVTSYMNVLRDQAVLELNVNNERVLSRQLEATRDRFEVGEITRTDVHQAEARLATATADRIGAEGSLVSSRATYRNVVGMPPESLQPATPPADLPATEDAAQDEALANAPDVVAARFDTRALRWEIDEVRGELLPTLSVEGSTNTSLEVANEDTRTQTHQVILSLSMPLYQSGDVYSRLRAATQSAGQQRLLVDAALRDVIESVTAAWESLLTARAQITSFQTAIEAASVALEGVQREAEVGSRTVLDVLDAEQELLDARVNLVVAQRDEVVAAYQLKSAMGHLTAQRLGLAVEVYDPAVHYEEVRGKWFGGSASGEYELEDLP